MFNKLREHPITFIIIILNLLFYIYNTSINGGSVIGGIDPTQRLAAGGMSQGYGIWRVFTALFVHASLFHLVTNMFMLYILAMMIDDYVSNCKFALIYLLSGLIGNFIGLWQTSDTVMCGASTAIFGVLGIVVFKAMVEFKHNIKQVIAVIALTIYLLFLTFVDGNTNNFLHISGLVSGFIIILIYKSKIIISHIKREI